MVCLVLLLLANDALRTVRCDTTWAPSLQGAYELPFICALRVLPTSKMVSWREHTFVNLNDVVS
jgi:hypothetical protein